MNKEIYQEQLDELESLSDLIVSSKHLNRILPQVMGEIFEETLAATLSLETGIQIPPKSYLSSGYCKLNEYIALSRYLGDGNKTIPYPDCGTKHPENGWYVVIDFPCGAYSMGNIYKNCYPTKSFDAFFDELKSFSPEYSDTTNHILYFKTSHPRISELYNSFNDIFNKHKDSVAEEMRQQEVWRLERELEKLRGE